MLVYSWLAPPARAEREGQGTAICSMYEEAQARVEQGEARAGTDVQALQRKHPGLPLAYSKAERRDCEGVWPGTRSFIVSRDVVTGQTLAPAGAPTRSEADFPAYPPAVVATRWRVDCDRLNMHRSSSLASWVAELSGIEEELGVAGESGMLASMINHAAFLCDSTHSITFHRVFFLDTPMPLGEGRKERYP